MTATTTSVSAEVTFIMDINLERGAQETECHCTGREGQSVLCICVIFMFIMHCGAVRLLPVTDVVGESGGFLRVFSQQSLIARERLHQTHVAGQRHGLFNPHTLVPVIHKKKFKKTHSCTASMY